MEEFKKIKGFSKYSVSKDGRIYSSVSNKMLKCHRNSSNGYYQVILRADNGTKHFHPYHLHQRP